MKKNYLLLLKDSLFRNSLYLLLSTIVMAGLGFVFWLLVAHFYSSGEVGIASTLISAMTLVSYTSLLGFNSTFIRFLPTSKNRNEHINTGLILTIGMAIIVATTYVMLVPYIAPKLTVIHHPLYGLGFVLLTALAAVNLLTDSIFIALRAAKYNLIINGFIMSTTKVLLPLLFLSLGAYGIFAASGSAAVIALLASLYFLVKKFNYKPALRIDKLALEHVKHYSLSSYIANLLNIAPTLLLPIIVINKLGASSAAYYYLAFMIANLLYTIAYSVSQSLFAEGSYEDRAHKELIKKATLALSALLIVGVGFLYVAAPYLLKVFGESYSQEATSLLRILTVASPAVALYVVVNVLLRLKKQTRSIIVINVLYMLVICILALFWAQKGLVWIGYSWLLGNLLSGAAGVVLLLVNNFKPVNKVFNNKSLR